MPIYEVQCPSCRRNGTIYRSVEKRDADLPECDCTFLLSNPPKRPVMRRIITAPYVAADMTPYQSMIDGSWITSRSRHNDHLKAHGCIEIGNEMHHLKAKEKPELSKESRAARKQAIVEQVNALK